MDKNDLDKWCKEKGYNEIKYLNIKPAILKDYKLCFNYFSNYRNCGTANIMCFKGFNTYGLLINIAEIDKKTIRDKEGYPNNYSEITINVETFDGELIKDVLTYKVIKEREKREYQPPSRCYMNLIINNAEKYGFPAEYKKYLRSLNIK
jgi:hypothetical protein